MERKLCIATILVTMAFNILIRTVHECFKFIFVLNKYKQKKRSS